MSTKRSKPEFGGVHMEQSAYDVASDVLGPYDVRHHVRELRSRSITRRQLLAELIQTYPGGSRRAWQTYVAAVADAARRKDDDA